MDWQIKPIARHSAVSGSRFEIGERVVSLIYLDTQNELSRMDVSESDLHDFTIPNNILGRWVREVKPPDDGESEAKRQTMATAEQLFISLYDNEDNPTETAIDAKETLKQVLALMLERKRILKPVRRLAGKQQIYRHVKSNTEYKVSIAELSAEQLIGVQASLESLVSL